MSLQIDDLDQIDGESTQTSNDDIFSNPLEAFPEFIDEPVQAVPSSAEPAPEPVKETASEAAGTPAAEPDTIIEKKETPITKAKTSSGRFTDPLDTIEEIDIAALSQGTASLSFDDSSSPADVSDAADTDAGSFFAKANLTLGSIDYEDVAVRKTDDYVIDDSVPEETAAPEATEEVSLDDFLSPSGNEMEEVDLDSFLSDDGPSPSASGNVTEEVSLDDFGVDFGGFDSGSGFDASAIDAFASSMKSERAEKSDIENAPAIDMELVFDDEFVLETKANPEDDIDFDFEALMSGDSIPVPKQEATGDELLDNFDDIFDNIVDEGSPAPSAGGVEFDPSAIEEVSLDAFGVDGGVPSAAHPDSAETVSEQQIVFDEVSEFDDLLTSFSDDTHVEVAEKQTDKHAGPASHDYNIIVVMEEDDETAATPAPQIEEDDEEDYVISIFRNEEEAELYRNHDNQAAAQSSADQASPSDFQPSVSVDSGSFEDISLDDFGVTFEDETPSAPKDKPAEAASEAPAEEENLDEPVAPAATEAIPETEPETEPDFMEEETSGIPEGLDIPEDEPDFASMDVPDFAGGSDIAPEIAAEIPEDEPELSTEALPDMPDEPVFEEEALPDMPDEPVFEEEALPDMPDEPVFEEEALPDMPDEPEFAPEIPDTQEISFEEQYGDVPTVDNIIRESETSTTDDKIIVDKPEISVYNEDNTEDTSNMIDDKKEEITDTMNEGLLEKIVSELSVLRNEMQNLRDEVQTLKGGSEAAFEEPVAEETAPADDFTVEEPAFEEPVVEESAPADDFAMEEPAVEEPAIEESAISEEAPADDFAVEAPADEAVGDIPLPEADPFAAPQEAGGFFSGDDDDETIALSGDELNNILNSADFTQEDGSNFGMEAPEGSILPDDMNIEAPADDFAVEAPAEEAPADDIPMDIPAEPAADDFSMDIPAEEAPADDFAVEAPAEETPADDIPMDIPAEPATDDLDINFDEPVASEEPVISEEPAAESEEMISDDFNTDLPSLKDDASEASVEEPAVEEAAATESSDDNFSLDDFDIPEPSVDESSIADIDIDEPDTEPKADEEFSLDEFDIPEPSVDESSIADIDIDEPAADIPSDEPAVTEEAPVSDNADSDFYANSESSAISEEDISAMGMQENLEEPVLDDIDFGMDEPASDDIEIPTGESLIVDSSATDFLEEDDPTLDEQLTSDKVDYLNEEASAEDLGSLPEIEDIPDAAEEAPAVESMEDSLEADTIATSEDETPASDVFSSQWDETPAEAPADAASFDAEPEEEEIVHAATSFDDPIGFDIEAPAEETAEPEAPAFDEQPAAEPAFDAISDYEEPAAEAAGEPLSGDIKQEVKSVLKYMDQLLENLPEDKIAEFAQSEHFETYKKLFNELGLV